MRRVKKLGFAGLPGVVLDEHDVRQLVSQFEQEESSGALSGLGALPAASSATLNDKIAARVFRELGATDLAKVAVNPQESALVKRAGIAAVGVAHVLKFQTDKFAVLGSMTSPLFAKSVQRTAQKLHGLPESDRLTGALTFNFLSGVMDAQAKKKTFYADAYRKVTGDLAQALAKVRNPEDRAKAETILKDLGLETLETALSGLGISPTGFNDPGSAVLDTLTATGVATPAKSAFWAQTAARYDRAQTGVTPSCDAACVLRDTGSKYVAPLSVKIVSNYGMLRDLWDNLVHPVQTTVPAWKRDKPFGNDRAAAIQSGRNWAKGILDARSRGDASITPGRLLAAWFITHYADSVNNYANSGIPEDVWDRYKKIPLNPTSDKPYLPILPYEGSVGQPLQRSPLATWAFRVNIRQTELEGSSSRTSVGLYTTQDKGELYFGVASRQFYYHCMIAYYGATELTRSAIIDVLNTPSTSFPVVVGYAMALARWDALNREGLIGKYDGFEWVPDPAGSEFVPAGTEIYANWAAKAGPDEQSIRFDAIPLVQTTYREFYNREPTRHAIGWYGRMGYGLGRSMFDLKPDEVNKYRQAITRTTEVPGIGRRTADDERSAGADLGEKDAENRKNWFLVVGTKISGVMSSVIDAMSRGLSAAKDILCKTLKWMFGTSVGGVLCSVLSALLDLFVGQTIALTAAQFALSKAIILFLGHLTAGKWANAIRVLMQGIAQALFFIIGGPLAGVIGLPLLRSQEKELREKAVREGKNPDDVYPSLERMADELVRDEPFFIISFISAVLGLALAGPAGALALRKASGEVMLCLCPIVGVFLAPVAMRWIANSTDEWVKKAKGFTQRQVQDAITKICKILCYAIIGILSIVSAFKLLRDKWSAYVLRKGGTGAAAWSAVKFFSQRLGADLLIFFTAMIAAASNGFKDGPAMDLFSQASRALFTKIPQVIIAFASEELGAEKAQLEEFSNTVRYGFESFEKAQQEFISLKEMFSARGEQLPIGPELPPEVVAEKKKEKERKESRSKALLPLFGLAAGLAVGFVLFGGSDSKA